MHGGLGADSPHRQLRVLCCTGTQTLGRGEKDTPSLQFDSFSGWFDALRHAPLQRKVSAAKTYQC